MLPYRVGTNALVVFSAWSCQRDLPPSYMLLHGPRRSRILPNTVREQYVLTTTALLSAEILGLAP